MRALIYPAPDQATIIHTERVGPGPGEILVRSRVVGVCHSDLHFADVRGLRYDRRRRFGHQRIR